MDLHEDASRLQQILSDITLKDIIKFLRTKVPLGDKEKRCQLALQHFINFEDNLAKEDDNFEEDLRADFLGIKYLFKDVPENEIHILLDVLGPIPNRKHVAVRLLLRKQFLPNFAGKKRRCSTTVDDSEVTSTKVVRKNDESGYSEPLQNGDGDVTDSTATNNNNESTRPEQIKLKFKNVKDGNGNQKYVVSVPPTKITPATVKFNKWDVEEIAPKPSTSKQNDSVISLDTTMQDVIEIPDQEKDDDIPDGWRFEEDAVELKYLNDGDEPVAVIERLTKTDSPDTTNGRLTSPLDLTSTVDNIDSPYHHSDNSSSSTESYDIHNLNLDIASTLDISATPGPSNEAPVLVPDQENNEDRARVVDERLFLKMVEIFPDASSDYLRNLCVGKQWEDFDIVLDMMCETNGEYPRRPERAPTPENEVDPEQQLNTLKNLFPDADPTYLQATVESLSGDQEGFSRFINEKLENKDYPTMKEYLRKQQLSAQQKQYTTEFKVERFLELFPDPVSVFEDPNRKTTILSQGDKYYVKWFMRNLFNQLYVNDVNKAVDNLSTKNVISIVSELNSVLARGHVKKSRVISHSRPHIENIPLLQELAFHENKQEILKYIETKKLQAELARQNAKDLGLLKECECCFDNEVMPDDILTCTGGHQFCKECIRRSTEVAFGEGKIDFKCLAECEESFCLQVLQNALSPKVFSKIAQKKALAEVKAAGIEDLETCPFCDFATILAPEDRLFRCLNADCMKESCRLCKEPSHVPLRCDEVEKDEAVKARTFIENKMSEALIRECWKCQTKFIKEEGCNKMTCSKCGAMSCYICRMPVKDYKHFNGQGGDRTDLCPLYSDNILVNEKNVLKAAEEAKQEVDPTTLKIDPTAGLAQQLHKRIKEAEKKAQQRANHAHMHLEMQVARLRGLQHEIRIRGHNGGHIIVAHRRRPHQLAPPAPPAQAALLHRPYLPPTRRHGHVAQEPFRFQDIPYHVPEPTRVPPVGLADLRYDMPLPPDAHQNRLQNPLPPPLPPPPPPPPTTRLQMPQQQQQWNQEERRVLLMNRMDDVMARMAGRLAAHNERL